MEYTFASQRQLSFIVCVGGRNLLVSFGSRSQAGVSTFMTPDEKVAQAVRRHSLSRRGIIQETTKPDANATGVVAKPAVKPTGVTAKPEADALGAVAKSAGKAVGTTAAEPKEREYDNYTVARESICKELGIKKSEVRNPSALAKVAQEHGIIIKYKEM